MEFAQYKVEEYEIIFRTKKSFGFVSYKPFLPYHFLISPIRIVPRFQDLTADECNDLIECIQKAVKGLESLGTSWNINLQDGKEAGQTVAHVHFHLIPRNEGDLKRNDDVYDKIDINSESSIRTPEELTESANFLKSLLKKLVDQILK